MPTPIKPYAVLTAEKKSHRTKKELKLRQDGEKSLATGTKLKEKSEVKKNPIAHKEFLRLQKLLVEIEKNDAIYEIIINRYCIIYAECFDLEARRDEVYDLIHELRNTFYETADELEPLDKAMLLNEFTKSMAKLSTTMINLDRQVQTKRRMLLDIEKESIMTIAAALRSIPKKVEKAGSKLMEALNGS